MAKKQTKAEIKTEYKYSVELNVVGKSYLNEGDDLATALEFNPEINKGRSYIKVKKNGKVCEKALFPRMLKRLVVNKNYRILLAKQLDSLI